MVWESGFLFGMRDTKDNENSNSKDKIQGFFASLRMTTKGCG